VTGESLGQVASQTLDNVAVIDEAARGPVLRPLIGMDKEEITREARRIGTFDVSTLPDEDCCQLFVPRSPATAAKLAETRSAETTLDVRALVDSCVAQTEDERFSFPGTPWTRVL
jgi:thiamine biosynthesis protein ThiI